MVDTSENDKLNYIIKQFDSKATNNKIPIKGLIEDVSSICLSYLTENEQIYIKKEWDSENFQRTKYVTLQQKMDG